MITIPMYDAAGNLTQMPIEKALDIMSDEWVDNGEFCAQNLIDLRDACRKLNAATSTSHNSAMAKCETCGKSVKVTPVYYGYCCGHRQELRTSP